MTLVQQTVARQESVMALHRTAAVFFRGCLASDWEKKEELFYSVSPLFIDVITCFCNWNQDIGRYPLACLDVFTSCVVRCFI